MKTTLASRYLVPLCIFAAGSASAQTVIVVDDDGGVGVDYTEIQPAIDAAGPLDRIEVRGGSYGSFVASGPVSIIGRDSNPRTAYFDEGVFTGLMSGEIAVLADVHVETLVLTDSDGTQIVDAVRAGRIEVTRCADARLQTSAGNSLLRTEALDVVDSFVQCMDLLVLPQIAGIEEDGDAAITSTRSTLYLTNCEIEGGAGGDQGLCWGGYLPEGGPALALRSSDVRLLGSEISGGGQGWDCFSSPSGVPGPNVSFLDGDNTVVEADTTFYRYSYSYQKIVGSDFEGPGAVTSLPGLPWLALGGGTAPGTAALFDFHAEPGSALRAFLGRRPVVVAVPGLAVPLLHSAERGVSLGATPGTGSISLPFVLPNLPTGTLIHVQSSRTAGSGA
ncbi:MAG: hypothetical protein VX460_09900, partial [Planctomycetota bacterium]|nr:hypothetical protein [Planctomycetota bacterium]